MTAVDPRYSPHLFKCIYILLLDSLVGFYFCLVGLPSFVFDFLLQMFFGSYLPTSIKDLVDVDVFNRLSERRAISVSFANQKEQHANSTERAWLIVHYEGDLEPTYVFAKCQARNVMVRLIMSIFNVYKNELMAYKELNMGIPTAKAYIAKWTRSRFVLVLEDLSKHQQVEFPNIWSKHVDVDLAKKVLTTLATLHAKFWAEKCPRSVWTDENRPYQGIGMGMYTLFNVENTCQPGLIPENIHKSFMQALWHWNEYRTYLSASQPKTMCHGDSHMGNFYITGQGEIGAVDFQVLSEENPLRDVTYFLSSSCDPLVLEANEKELIRFYLGELARLGVANPPTFEQAWFAYRLQLFYTLYAFVFSGGFANLMDHVQTDCGVSRIVKVMQRVDSTAALYEMLDGRGKYLILRDGVGMLSSNDESFCLTNNSIFLSLGSIGNVCNGRGSCVNSTCQCNDQMWFGNGDVFTAQGHACLNPIFIDHLVWGLVLLSHLKLWLEGFAILKFQNERRLEFIVKQKKGTRQAGVAEANHTLALLVMYQAVGIPLYFLVCFLRICLNDNLGVGLLISIAALISQFVSQCGMVLVAGRIHTALSFGIDIKRDQTYLVCAFLFSLVLSGVSLFGSYSLPVVPSYERYWYLLIRNFAGLFFTVFGYFREKSVLKALESAISVNNSMSSGEHMKTALATMNARLRGARNTMILFGLVYFLASLPWFAVFNQIMIGIVFILGALSPGHPMRFFSRRKESKDAPNQDQKLTIKASAPPHH